MAGVPSDRLITCVTDVATHLSPVSRLMTLVGARGMAPATNDLPITMPLAEPPEPFDWLRSA